MKKAMEVVYGFVMGIIIVVAAFMIYSYRVELKNGVEKLASARVVKTVDGVEIGTDGVKTVYGYHLVFTK